MIAAASSGRKPYGKPHLSFEAQAKQLVDRGMGGDVAQIAGKLAITNYYRLSGYFHHFRRYQGPLSHLGEQFRPGVHFDDVLSLYAFDGRLRRLLLEAIEVIEVAVRTQVAYHHARRFGPFAYALDPASLPDLGTCDRNGVRVSRRDEFLGELDRSLGRSREQFVDHFYDTYSDPYPPIWVAAEVLSLGAIAYVFNGSPVDLRSTIAQQFNATSIVIGSWLLTLNAARNVCAHHARLWNRAIGAPPRVPHHESWHMPVEIFPPHVPGTIRPTTFVVLSICNHLLSEVAPGTGWARKVKGLIDEHPTIKPSAMGFPANWTASPVWHDVD